MRYACRTSGLATCEAAGREACVLPIFDDARTRVARRRLSLKMQAERVGGVGFVTPQVIRPESHQNRAPPGLGD